ncbi:MAG: SH3 beta-barrel fold-containing protein [Candidatus Hodarchaeales archaeon]|jgi:hypothetical protein
MEAPHLLKELLKDNDVLVRFVKKNGEDRAMVCTLRQQVIEQYERKTVGSKPRPDTLYVVWDLEKDAWRMFDIGTLFEYHVL